MSKTLKKAFPIIAVLAIVLVGLVLAGRFALGGGGGDSVVFHNNVRVFVYFEGTDRFAKGSGFIVQDQNDEFYVLTAAHVVQEENRKIKRILGRFNFSKGDNWYYTDTIIEPVFIDEYHDFALMKLLPSKESMGYWTFIDGEEIKTLDELYSYLSFRDSVVGGSGQLREGQEAFFFSADRNHSSKGPIVGFVDDKFFFDAGTAIYSQERAQIFFERGNSIMPGDSGSAVAIRSENGLEIVGILLALSLSGEDTEKFLVTGKAIKINTVLSKIEEETGLILQ